jgi:ATP-binding cassette subfamily B protein/ATP-binding cassette subfamily C protein
MKRPEILLLDEPTAHLDPANEQLLARTLRRISSECTVLVVAHCDATIRSADQVVVLDGGRVISAGDYAKVRHLLSDDERRTGRSVDETTLASHSVTAAVSSTRDN